MYSYFDYDGHRYRIPELNDNKEFIVIQNLVVFKIVGWQMVNPLIPILKQEILWLSQGTTAEYLAKEYDAVIATYEGKLN